MRLLSLLCLSLLLSSCNNHKNDTKGVEVDHFDKAGLADSFSLQDYIHTDPETKEFQLNQTVVFYTNMERLGDVALIKHEDAPETAGLSVTKSEVNDVPLTEVDTDLVFAAETEMATLSSQAFLQWLIGSDDEPGFLTDAKIISDKSENKAHYRSFRRTSSSDPDPKDFRFNHEYTSRRVTIVGQRLVKGIGKINWNMTLIVADQGDLFNEEWGEADYGKLLADSGIITLNSIGQAFRDPWHDPGLNKMLQMESVHSYKKRLVAMNSCASESLDNFYDQDNFFERSIDAGLKMDFVTLRRGGSSRHFANTNARFLSELVQADSWKPVVLAFNNDDYDKHANAVFDRNYDREGIDKYEQENESKFELFRLFDDALPDSGSGNTDLVELPDPPQNDPPVDTPPTEVPPTEDPPTDLPDDGANTDDPGDLPDDGANDTPPGDLPDDGGDVPPIPDPPPPTPDDGGSDDPLVLDLDLDGVVSLKPLSNNLGMVRFDLDADGHKEKVRWFSSGAGIVALDRNGNGTIDNGLELFGDRRALNNFDQSKHGFQDLALLDNNADGLIDTEDAVWNYLLIWNDRNENGLSEPEELVSVQTLINQINVINFTQTRTQLELGGQSTLVQTGSYKTVFGDNALAASAVLQRGLDLYSRK